MGPAQDVFRGRPGVAAPLSRRAAALAFAAALLAACGRRRRKPPAPPPRPAPARPGAVETGLASWYGHPYHGRRAANGEIYDMEQLTAAHRTLPFETWVRVTHLANAREVDVRITDRGPFIQGRIIDLSHAAARAIELIGPGVSQVRVTVLRGPSPQAAARFAVQVGAFRERRNAEALRDAIEARHGSARLVEKPGNPVLWRVLAGSEPSEEDAGRLAARIRQEGNENNSAFVVRIDSP